MGIWANHLSWEIKEQREATRKIWPFHYSPFPTPSRKLLTYTEYQCVCVILKIKKPRQKHLKNVTLVCSEISFDLWGPRWAWVQSTISSQGRGEILMHRLKAWFSSLSSWALGQVNGQESFHLQSKMGWKALLAHFVHINYTCLQFINSFSPLYPYVM